MWGRRLSEVLLPGTKSPFRAPNRLRRQLSRPRPPPFQCRQESEVLTSSSISPEGLSATWMGPASLAGSDAPQRGRWQVRATLESGSVLLRLGQGAGHTRSYSCDCAGAATSAPQAVCFVGTCDRRKLRAQPRVTAGEG